MAAKLLTTVKNVLRENLTDLDSSGLEYVKETRRVMGFVVSPDFKSVDHGKRQRRLKRILKKELTEEEFLHVGPIVTMNPNEARLQDVA